MDPALSVPFPPPTWNSLPPPLHQSNSTQTSARTYSLVTSLITSVLTRLLPESLDNSFEVTVQSCLRTIVSSPHVQFRRLEGRVGLLVLNTSRSTEPELAAEQAVHTLWRKQTKVLASPESPLSAARSLPAQGDELQEAGETGNEKQL